MLALFWKKKTSKCCTDQQSRSQASDNSVLNCYSCQLHNTQVACTYVCDQYHWICTYSGKIAGPAILHSFFDSVQLSFISCWKLTILTKSVNLTFSLLVTSWLLISLSRSSSFKNGELGPWAMFTTREKYTTSVHGLMFILKWD